MKIKINWFNTYLLILGIISLIFTIPIRNFLITATTETIPNLISYFMAFCIAMIILLILSIIAFLIVEIIQEISKGNFFFFKIKKGVEK